MDDRARIVTDSRGAEKRLFVVDDAEMRQGNTEEGEDTPSLEFKGHAAVFNSRTFIGPAAWGFFEEIDSAAFNRALEEKQDVRFLQNHDANFVLARTTNDTLTLRTDKVGLAVEADMAPVSYARDLSILLNRRDVSQMSFAFAVKDDEWRTVKIKDPDTGDELEADLRVVKDVDLYDVAVVTYPAYSDTDAALRAGTPREHGTVVEELRKSRALVNELDARLWAMALPKWAEGAK